MPLSPRKSPQKVELSQVYPCPCCHQGQLRLITLTEALGCSRCQHIFAIMPSHLHIEQLAVSHPRKLWHWNGSHWVLEREEVPPSSTMLALVVVMVALVVVAFMVASRLAGATEVVSWLGVLMVFLVGVFLTVLILRRP